MCSNRRLVYDIVNTFYSNYAVFRLVVNFYIIFSNDNELLFSTDLKVLNIPKSCINKYVLL